MPGNIVIGLLLLAALALAPRTQGAVATVQLSGTWTTVNDTASVLDGSIGVGSNYVATLVYDDTTTNANTGSDAALTATYLVTPGQCSFNVTSGNYSFTLPVTEGVEIDVDHLYTAASRMKSLCMHKIMFLPVHCRAESAAAWAT